MRLQDNNMLCDFLTVVDEAHRSVLLCVLGRGRNREGLRVSEDLRELLTSEQFYCANRFLWNLFFLNLD